MFFKVVFACVLFATVPSQSITSSTTRRPFTLGIQNALNSLSGSAKSTIQLFNTTGQTATKVVKDGVQGFTSAGKTVVTTAGSLKSSALQGGVSAVKHGVDIGSNMVAIIPGMSGIASIGAGVIKAGADVGNAISQAGISLGTGMANGKLELINGLTSAGTGLASNGINMGANMADRGVETGFKMANSAVGTVSDVIENAMNYANKASGKVSSVATSVADRMSSAASLPSSLNLNVATSTSG